MDLPSSGQLWLFLGRLHPLVVHFPIALILLAVAVEFLRRRYGRPRPAPFAVACLVLGAVSAGLAAALGWSSAQTAGYGSTWVVDAHRWVGIALAGMAIVASALALSTRALAYRRFAFYRLTLFTAGILVILAGHFGAMLVHGEGYIDESLALLRSPEMPGGSGSNAIAPLARAEEAAHAPISFGEQVLPILARRCFSCHKQGGEDGPKSGRRLDTLEGMLAGGESGEPAIIPGHAARSHLIALVSSDDADERMPPKGRPLSDGEIGILRAWIDAGARWEEEDQRLVSGAWHWAYKPVVRHNPPFVNDTHWPRNPIDHFVLARLEREGLPPSAEADRAVLLRRVSLDLTGLPPTPAEIDAFLADARPDAYERQVDRLLESPSFGERWARLWLDLARYADTHGYEKDDRRIMHPYRDWVIEAFNRDLPFDRFTIDQLAGDLLPGAKPRQLIATGFHRNTQINLEGGTDAEEFRVEAVLDRANTTASVWLGATMACAQCHDHKFDPVSQEEYFRFYAFFNQDEPDAVVVNETATEKRAAGPTAPAPDWTAIDEFEQRWAELASAKDSLAAAERSGSPEAEPLRQAVARGQAALDALKRADAMVMGRAPAPRSTHVFERGSFLSPGKEVSPGTPACLSDALDPPTSPDRLGLARWIVDPRNPLTARVHANRLWAQLFARGLVETEEDFGTQGDLPTHPELLDWLASEFVRQGWSQKQLLRTMVTSATYRQSSALTPELIEKDPDNRLLARAPRPRLEGEMIRDVALAAAGLLSPRMYGPSVFPPQPPGIWTQIYSGDQWVESQGEDRFRRGLYTFWRRTSHYPTLATFDAPSREIACTRRPRTNTPLQALTTLNDPQFVEAAGALARRVLAEATTSQERVELAFRLCLARRPEPEEAARLLSLLEAQSAAYALDDSAARALAAQTPGDVGGFDPVELASWTIVASVILNLDETLTRG